MPPPRVVVKKSTTTEETVHRGPHKHRESRIERVVEEVSEEDVDMDLEQDGDGDEGASQGSEDLDALLKSIAEAQRKRRANRRIAITKSHDEKISKTRADIASIFDAHEKEVSQTHQTTTTRLADLLKAKAQLETEMLEIVQDVRAGFLAHSDDFSLVLRHRAAQIEEVEGKGV